MILSRYKISGFALSHLAQLLFVVFCMGCLSPIEIEGITTYLGGQLVVSGEISTIAEQNIIQLGLTASTERVPFPLSGAMVTVMDNIGNAYSYPEDPLRPGFYVLDNVTGVMGVAYHVQIVTSEGKVYESTTEVMPPPPGAVKTNYEIVNQEHTDGEGTVTTSPFVKVYADVTLPESTKSLNLKWTSNEDFVLTPTDFPDPFAQVPPSCYIAQNADPQRITLLNSDNFSTASFDHVLIASRLVDWTFLERHYFTTYQSSLTDEAYEYWRKVNILSNNVGSIFDTPPAEIHGNIVNVNDPTEKVHGYFQAANEVYDRFFLLPADFPFPLLFDGCSFESFSTQYPPRCLECISVRNSSYNRPGWF